MFFALMAAFAIAAVWALFRMVRRTRQHHADRVPIWLWIAVAGWLASFFLPTVELGGTKYRVVAGFVAAFLSCFVFFAALLNSSQGTSSAYGGAAGVLFLALAASNALFIVAMVSQRPSRTVSRLVLTSALLVWAVPFVNYPELYAAMGLEKGERVTLHAGYFVWAASFALLAIGLRHPVEEASVDHRQ